MTRVLWDAVLLLCGGACCATDLHHYSVEAGWAANALFEVAQVEAPATEAVLPFSPGPGECLFVRVHAVDVAGNSSKDCAQP